MLQRLIRSSIAIVIVLAALMTTARAVGQSTRPERPPELNPRWFERLDPVDRALLQGLVGFAPPAFTPDLTWIGDAAPTWEELRGKVVLLQSWTNGSTHGRRVIRRAEKLAKATENADLRVILVHTPEGAEHLQRFLERRSVSLPIALDSGGGFCDDIGFYKEPANILVDRNGVVRLVGLNTRGLNDGIEALLAEPVDPAFTPPVRGKTEGEDAGTTVRFPTFSIPVNDADDLRGKPAPDFFVERWETPEPNARGKVVVLNFWSTECDICVDLLEHLNGLADHFRGDVCIVGVSDESSSNFKEGRAEHRLSDGDFRHAIALDPSARMKRAMGIRAIPHCVVISSDWIVRWQGHPGRLNADIISRIVRADTANSTQVAGGAGGAERPRRWELSR